MIDDAFQAGFEEDGRLCSAFIRDLILDQVGRPSSQESCGTSEPTTIPRTLVRYWHDLDELPDDVGVCLSSWDRLQVEGVKLQMFNDATAASYIESRYGDPERAAFGRCRHPAMRSDYFRMCFVLAEGGAYVDADDVLVEGDGWRKLFLGSRLKVQPLCYDIPVRGMLPASHIWRKDLSTEGRIFYVNNNPLVAPVGHPVLRRALSRATDRLLGNNPAPEIQSTTGPGNLTVSLAAHARELKLAGALPDFELLQEWSVIGETRWNLSYREDARNWRNMDAR